MVHIYFLFKEINCQENKVVVFSVLTCDARKGSLKSKNRSLWN